MEDKIKNNENDMLSIGEFNEILQQKNFNMRDTLKNKEFSLYNLKKEKENTKDFIDEGIKNQPKRESTTKFLSKVFKARKLSSISLSISLFVSARLFSSRVVMPYR